MTLFGPHRVFWDVERLTMHAYWIWRIVISRCWAICSYFHSMSRKVVIWMRWSRVNSNCFLRVADAFIMMMMRRMLNENFDESNYIELASHTSARTTLTINPSTYQVEISRSFQKSMSAQIRLKIFRISHVLIASQDDYLRLIQILIPLLRLLQGLRLSSSQT
jgi:hypothetical protein